MNFATIAKRPSAWLPVGMSLAALATVMVHLALYGTARQPDEGSAAHIFQILMAAQLPVILVFAAKWLCRAPREALVVLGVQLAAAVLAMAPVAYVHL